MKILFLGPYKDNIQEFLLSYGDSVVNIIDKIQPEEVLKEDFEFIVSYGYRYIIPINLVDYYKDRIINLHISYLPWNKGADPNLWSVIEDTPKGVTVHYIDKGLDTGDIIAQKKIVFESYETLFSSYQKLTFEIEKLFIQVWPLIRQGKNTRTKQVGKGSYHRLKDKEDYAYLLKDGWNTPVSNLIGAVKRGEN
ncbi:formyltransferase family protein [Psychrobacillus sp. FSL H8-0484]|uniref:formyltransferase family protein n=1 Tax=Psychrobacillus sp. FSL H8-0484 TaxID=2921390 RepID=UPI0030FC9C3E